MPLHKVMMQVVLVSVSTGEGNHSARVRYTHVLEAGFLVDGVPSSCSMRRCMLLIRGGCDRRAVVALVLSPVTSVNLTAGRAVG